MTAPARPDRRRGVPWVAAIAAVVLLLLMWRTSEVLLIVFLAVMLAVYLDAFAELLTGKLDVPARLSTFVAVILTTGAAAGVVLLIAPPIAEQVRDLLAGVPGFLKSLDQNFNSLLRRIPLLGATIGDRDPAGLLASAMGEVVNFFQGAAVPYLTLGIGIIIEGISVLVMALFLARSPRVYADGLVALVPPEHRVVARAILADLAVTLRAWILGQLLSMVALAVLTTLGLWLLGVPYALAFGAFAGVAAIVPFFGVLFSTLLPALFALTVGGLPQALWVVALGVVVHLIEANLLAPLVTERQVNLPPVITIAGILVIGKLFGLIGLLVAVPILAVSMVLVRHILLGEVYGDPIAEVEPAGTIPSDVTPGLGSRSSVA